MGMKKMLEKENGIKVGETVRSYMEEKRMTK